MADSTPWVIVTDPNRFLGDLAQLKANGGGELILSNGTYAVNADLTVDASITLNFMNGAKLNINSGISLILNGRIEAGMTQIFAGDGLIKGKPQVKEFYPQWFGAVADGKADDTRGIQSAINTVASIGGTLVFPAAAYNAGTVSLKPGAMLAGEKGAVLQNVSQGTDTIFLASGISSFEVTGMEGKISFNLDSCTGFHIHQLRIAGNTGSWIFSGCSNGMITQNQILNTNNVNERILYLSGCSYMLVEGNQIKNQLLFNNVPGNLNIGVNVSSSKYCRVINNHIENCGGEGITFDTNIGITGDGRRCFSNLATGNIVIGNGQEGITAFASSQFETFDITISGNICINNRYDGIELWGVRQCIVEGNSISAPAIKDYSFGAINMYASKDIIVNGNSIENVPTSGIATVNGSNYPEPGCSNIILTSNRIHNWNYQDMNPATNHDQNCGINLFGAEFTVVQGNLFLDTRPARKYSIKAISVVSGHHHIQGNINPGNLPIDDHIEADMGWGGRQIAERIPMLRMSQFQGDANNGNIQGIDPGSVWYNANTFSLYYKGFEQTMLTPMIIDRNSSSGFPSADYAPGFLQYQIQTGRLFFRGKPGNSNGKYAEVVLKDKFINLNRNTEVTKKPVEGDVYYDTVKKKPVYFDGTNWRDFSGNVVSVNP